MLSRFRSWHGGLSKLKKVGLWSATALVGLFAVGAGASPQNKNTDIPVDEPAGQVESAQTSNSPVITKKTTTETEVIPFEKSNINDGNLSKGKTEVRTAGVNGVKTITYDVTYNDGVETDNIKTKEEVTTAPTIEVTAVGSKVAVAPTPTPHPTPTPAPQPSPSPTPSQKCDPNYTPCIPYYSGNTLNCPDIGIRVHVIGNDHNYFDADNDGIGCESYPG